MSQIDLTKTQWVILRVKFSFLIFSDNFISVDWLELSPQLIEKIADRAEEERFIQAAFTNFLQGIQQSVPNATIEAMEHRTLPTGESQRYLFQFGRREWKQHW